jgi:hypothetical protein
MHRPACAEAVGLVNHDLNRAAHEVTAIQQARPQVLLLQSVTAGVWDAGRYSDCLYQLYTALSFAGLKLGFVTERQLEAGIIPDAPVLVVPGITHLSEEAMKALRQYQNHLVSVGEAETLTHDDWGRLRENKLPAERWSFRLGTASARDLHHRMLEQLRGWKIAPAVEVRGTDDAPPWGVEWRSAETPDGTVVNLCNYRRESVRVDLLRAGQTVSGQDVLTGARVDGPCTLKPLEVRLLRLAEVPRQ